MNLFSKIFKKKISVQSTKLYKNTNDYIEGEESFKIGWKLFKDYIIDESLSPERRKQKNIAALEFFDCAIEYGYDKAEVFSFRGICLRNLNYDLDALEDFNKCIDKDPERASFYYNRAMTKQYIYDYEGSLADFEKAIQLSKLDNADTRYWNDYAKQTGYNSGTQKYQHDLESLIYDIKLAKDSHYLQEKIKEKGTNIKKRFQ